MGVDTKCLTAPLFNLPYMSILVNLEIKHKFLTKNAHFIAYLFQISISMVLHF